MAFKSAERPLCRYCGKPIAKATEHHSVPGAFTAFKDDKLVTLDDCRKMTNQPIVSVKYHHENDDNYQPTGRRTAWSFTTWDGESWVDAFFCNGDHAKQYAYFAVRHPGKHTKDYVDAFNRRATGAKK